MEGKLHSQNLSETQTDEHITLLEQLYKETFFRMKLILFKLNAVVYMIRKENTNYSSAKARWTLKGKAL